MIPDNRLSSELMLADWLIDKPDTEFTRTTGYEQGPRALADTSSSLSANLWKYYYQDDTIILENTITGTIHELATVPNLTDLSVCFNQDGQPTYIYTVDARTYLRWYDTTSSSWLLTDLGTNITDPKIMLDIKDNRSTLSDIIIFYYKNTQNLCLRYQRERFSIERVLHTGTPHTLLRVGFNKINRIQFLTEEIL